jgi:hypothetical protein
MKSLLVASRGFVTLAREVEFGLRGLELVILRSRGLEGNLGSLRRLPPGLAVFSDFKLSQSPGGRRASIQRIT